MAALQPVEDGGAAPGDAVAACVAHGLACAREGRPFEAAAYLQNALRLDPENVPALLNLATIWRTLGHRGPALPCYRLAAKLAPQRVDTQFLLGTLLCELRELDEAVAVHRQALALAPDHPGVLTDLGSALILRGDTDEGMELLQRTVDVAPSWPVGHVNLGIALVRERRFDAALAAFHAAEAADPAFDYARFCESNVYFLRGDIARGYAMYDAHRAVYPHRYRERRWDGQPLGGRTILLYIQHGLGDTLQFVRYVPRVAAMGGRVVLQVQPKLLPLLATHPGAAVVQATTEPPATSTSRPPCSSCRRSSATRKPPSLPRCPTCAPTPNSARAGRRRWRAIARSGSASPGTATPTRRTA